MSKNKPIILVTEDSSIIAMALADELEMAGFAVAGPFARCCDAEKSLEDARPDCAVLDIRLNDGDCTGLAEELARREIPILIYSGFQQETCPVQIAATVWLEKPASPLTLVATIHRVLGPLWAGPPAPSLDQRAFPAEGGGSCSHDVR
jgi:DNA-binding response OmpR family regulator